ncbi:hypothetical protein HMPREF1624_04436 [Sporothrix schenckii ATCC 58251]|uniref:J domain-containing protein n=1 Tax=Sporothrix schenckii (strain ATCC 58251 / de Perez 2211183) TaxID=1391915 RepID=U7PUD4_SPOS1|nr:hypothetical protein HMPREF1624_04436 [Sporothrix schenckii ATCC 58251]
MSDTRRRSSRSSSTAHLRSSGGSSSTNNPSSSDTASNVSSSSATSSSRHRSARHSGAPSNRSSTSLHRIAGSSSNRSRESLAPSTPSDRPSRKSGASSSSTSSSSAATLQPPATDPGPSTGTGGIYGNLAGRASESRFSLTDQFASTRSVLDFGFDDTASSIFDAQSMLSVGTARAPSVYGYDGYDAYDGYEAAAAAAAAASVGGVGGLDPFAELGSMTPTASSTGNGLQGSPWQAEEEYLGGAYSTVLEENEDQDDAATIGGGRSDANSDGNDLTDDNDTPEQTPTKQKKRSRAHSSADVTVIGGGGGSSSSQKSPPRDAEILDELQDPLRLPVPVLPPAQRGPRSSIAAASAPPPARIPASRVHRSYYDLFCLSREQLPPPNGAQIRAAYFRLFRLLNSTVSNGSASNDPDKANLMPTALRPFAAAYFLEIQNAFETLIDPIRRLEYDRYLDDLEDNRTGDGLDDDDDDDSESEVDDGKSGKSKMTRSSDKATTAPTAPTVPTAAYPSPQAPAFVRKYDFQTTTDLGARYTVSGAHHRAGQLLPAAPNVASLDYSLTQSVRVGLPALRQYTEASLFQLQCRLQKARRLLHEHYGIGPEPAAQNSFKSRDGRTYYYTRRHSSTSSAAAAADQPLWPIRCGIPIVSLSASTYSLSTAAAAAGAVLPLGDRFQPLLPEVLGPARIAQLAHTRATGCVVLGYRQEFWSGSALANPPGSAPGPPPPSVVVDVEAEVLPRAAVTVRIAQTLQLPAATHKLERRIFGHPSNEPIHVEAMVQTGESSLFSNRLLVLSPSPSLPRFGLGLSRRVGSGNGNIFLCADSGNAWWSSSSSSSLDSVSSVFAPLIPPMVEVGYSMSPHQLGLHAGRPLTGPADRGLKGVDIDMDTLGSVTAYSSDRRNPVSPHGTWTVSAATTGYGSAAAYLRYGRTVFLTPLGRTPPSTAASNSRRSRRQRQSPQRAVRVEAELCAADCYFSDGYLAVRALAPVRWWGLRNGWTSNATTSFRSSTPASTTPPKLGLEVALSASSGHVHISLYWSRLGQRFKLPFLLLPNPASIAASSSTSATHAAAKLFVWAAIAPVAVMAVREVARIYWRAATKQWKSSRSKARAKRRGLTGKAAATAGYEHETADDAHDAGFDFDEEEEQAITHHRAEADELTMILASAVDAQRVLEQQMRQRSVIRSSTASDNDHHHHNELVIISAKYGVALADDPDDPDTGHTRNDSATSGLGHGIHAASPPVTAMASRNGWAPDYEVADVTAAVSALIVTGGSGNDATDSDYLYIPAGLQKGRLLGFWDPAPNYRSKKYSDGQPTAPTQRRAARGKKVLHVRYLWNGLERVAEVGDRAELRLP